MECENIFANPISDEGLIFRIYKELLQLNNKKAKKPIKNWAKVLNGHLSKEDIKIANKHKKRCSTSLVIREIYIKTTMRCHFILTRIAKMKKTDNSKCQPTMRYRPM